MEDSLTLLLLSCSIVMTAWPEQCHLDTISFLPDNTSLCCEEGEWLIRREGELACEPVPCPDPHTLMYEGECRDVLEDAVCGEEAVGERLYLAEDGRGRCDCMEGWLRYEGRCYQELTPAFCPPNTLLRLEPPKIPRTVISPDQLETLKLKIKLNISCLDNPCESPSLPHISTWSEDSPFCHEVLEDLEGCEVNLGDRTRSQT